MATEHDTVEYREIEGFPGYCVGSDGSVWSRRNNGGKLDSSWHVVRGVPSDSGHLRVTLRKGARSYNHSPHRLVLEAFVGPCPAGMECRHLDGSPGNNRLENLCWGTYVENADDARRHGTMYRGERQHLAKLSELEVRAIRARYRAGKGQRRKLPDGALAAIARDFGVSLTTVLYVASGRTWKHVV